MKRLYFYFWLAIGQATAVFTDEFEPSTAHTSVCANMHRTNNWACDRHVINSRKRSAVMDSLIPICYRFCANVDESSKVFAR
ncbi:hypothetical protein EMIT047CA2_10143 [Pseudomonas soli]